MQGSPDAKKPCKGILKTSSSFDKHSGASHRKSAKFDEINVLQTYHPPDKDYGHMKIEEPKTPFNYADPDEASGDQLDAELLAKKLTMAANTRTSSFDGDGDEGSSEEDLDETEEEKVKRIEFEKRRKAHYNEFAAVKLARKLIEEEDDDEEETDTNKNGNNSKSEKPSGSGKSSDSKKMDVEDDREDAQNTSPCSDN